MSHLTLSDQVAHVAAAAGISPEQARLAIAAMRKPTEDMLLAGAREITILDIGLDDPQLEALTPYAKPEAARMWPAMIDVALGKAPPPISAEGVLFNRDHVIALKKAVRQALDDMGGEGRGVCLATKARLRVAFEPFHDASEVGSLDMRLEEATSVLREVGRIG